jgi:hypothetical protein
MSVLSNTIDKRAEWAVRHRVIAARHRCVKGLLECALLIAVGMAVYCHHEALFALVQRWLAS